MKENGIAHHTSKFKMETQSLVLRRGQTFKATVMKTDEYMASADASRPFFFTLLSGAVARESDKTLVTVPLCTSREFGRLTVDKDKWGYQMLTNEDAKDITVEIYIPPNALASKYQFLIENDEQTLCQFQCPCYILFNPWCIGMSICLITFIVLFFTSIHFSGYIKYGSITKFVIYLSIVEIITFRLCNIINLTYFLSF